MVEAAIITTCMPISVPSIAEVVVTTSVLTPHVLVITQRLITLPVHHGTREWIMDAMTITVATTMASTIVVEAMTTIAAILAVARTKAAAMVAATTTAIVAAPAKAEATTVLHTPSRATAVARCASRRAADRNAFRAAQCVAPAALPVQQAHRTSAAAVRIVEAAALTAEVRVEAPTEEDQARMAVDIRDAKNRIVWKQARNTPVHWWSKNAIWHMQWVAGTSGSWLPLLCWH